MQSTKQLLLKSTNLWIMYKTLTVLGIGREGARGGLLQAFDDGGLACAILTHDQRQRLPEIDRDFIMRVKAPNPLD